MRLVMTMVVRDEADILVQNIEYHKSAGVDHFLITDHCSSDQTTEILRHFQRQGIVSFDRNEESAFRQDVWVTEMAQQATKEFGADWVINSDADEFWWPEEGGSLKNVLSLVHQNIDYLVVERSNFLYVGEFTGMFQETMIYRDLKSTNSLGKPLPPKVMHRGFEDILVAFGNHSAKRAQSSVTGGVAPITCFHFPVRSREQFRKKVRDGGVALSMNSSVGEGVGGTWRALNHLVANRTFDTWFDSFLTENLGRLSDAKEVAVDIRLHNALSEIKS